jgi:5-methyltetrahydrofolate--homocysteine methyltransferase
MVAIAREFAKQSALPLVIQSNAGLPENRGGQVVYPETPEFMANELRSLVRSGVAVIGGCCGTTPEHIRAIARCVKSA